MENNIWWVWSVKTSYPLLHKISSVIVNPFCCILLFRNASCTLCEFLKLIVLLQIKMICFIWRCLGKSYLRVRHKVQHDGSHKASCWTCLRPGWMYWLAHACDLRNCEHIRSSPRQPLRAHQSRRTSLLGDLSRVNCREKHHICFVSWWDWYSSCFVWGLCGACISTSSKPAGYRSRGDWVHLRPPQKY